jgi:hypothetical protein
MQQTAHTYTSHDGSLKARVHEYQSAQEAYERVQLSQLHANNPEMSDRLGEQVEIDIAEEILKTSLSMAAGAIGLGEIADIVEFGLMTEDEAQKLSEKKNKEEFKEKLQAQRQSSSNEDDQQI